VTFLALLNSVGLDCHNPTVHKIGEEYVVFYIGVGVREGNATTSTSANSSINNAAGSRASRKPSSGSRQHSSDVNQRLHSIQGWRRQSGRHPDLDKAQSIGAAWSTSPNGPWARTKVPLLQPSQPWERGKSRPAFLLRMVSKLLPRCLCVAKETLCITTFQAPVAKPQAWCHSASQCYESITHSTWISSHSDGVLTICAGGGPDCGVSNPAVMIRADGKLNMFYRGNQDRGVGVATASNWRGK
jgi:hypothetical protein